MYPAHPLLSPTPSPADIAQVDGYNISELVYKFGNLTRYNSGFSADSSVDILQLSNYGLSMLVYAAIGTIVIALLLAILLITCCLRVSLRSPFAPRKKSSCAPRELALRVAVVALTIVAACSFALSFVANSKIKDGMKKELGICHQQHQIVELLKNLNETTTNLIDMAPTDDSILSLADSLKHLSDYSKKIPNGNQTLTNTLGQYREEMRDLRTDIQYSVSTMKDRIRYNLVKKILDLLIPIDDGCRDRADVIYNLQVAFVIVLVLISLLLVLIILNRFFQLAVFIIGLLLLVQAMITANVTFVLLTAGSDLCLNLKPLALKYVDAPILDYYFYCPDFPDRYPNRFPDTSKHIDKLFREAQQRMNDAETNLDTEMNYLKQVQVDHCAASNNVNLKQFCATLDTSVNQLNQLEADTSSVAGNIAFAIQIVHCPPITLMIDFIISAVCTDVYDALYLLFVNSCLASVCYYLLLLIGIFL